MIFRRFCLLPFFLTVGLASELVEVSPLTDSILLVHFDDGFVERHQLGESRRADTVIVDPLDVELASQVSSYSLSSESDANYQGGKAPSSVGRKSKATDFSWICESWVSGQGCVNSGPDAALEHWLYLFLPDPLVDGASYRLELGSLSGGQAVEFVYDVKSSRSEAVHVNLLGYVPEATKKFGYVYAWLGDSGKLELADYAGNAFHLIDRETNESVFSGELTFRKDSMNAETRQPATDETPNQNFLGADVYECDFSGFTGTGKFRLAVEGIGCSFDFEIHPDIYREAFRTTVRGLYHNRSGIALEKPYTVFTRPAPHNPNLTPGFDGVIKYTSSRMLDWVNDNHSEEDKPAIENGIEGPINTWGWYQDAGDWDGYVTHMKIPSLLMFAFEAAPDNFKDGELNIPESGDGIPDILGEARWLLRFYYRTRMAMKDAGYGTGGVGGGRVAGDWFGGDEAEDGTTKASWTDVDRTYIVSGEDPMTSFKYAAIAAHYAYILGEFGYNDPEGIDWEEEAKTAYDWAIQNTLDGDDQIRFSGSFLWEYRLYAAAALYRLTGVEVYQTQFEADASSIQATSFVQGEARWGTALFAGIENVESINATLKDRMQQAMLATADRVLVTHIDQRACRWGGNIDQPMNVGQPTTPKIPEVILAYPIAKQIDPERAEVYLNNARTTADYFLGTNPLNMTWVTGLGERRPERLFHMDSWYNGRDEMVPGIVPYGPWQQSLVLGESETGPWQHVWANKYIYPDDIGVWPGHERWFEQWTSPLTNEFTVHQNTVISAVVYGFLCGSNEERDASAPSSPSEVTANELSSESAVLSWAETNDDVRVIGYNVYLDGELFDQIEGTRVSFDQLTAGAGYTVEIEAIDHAGNRSEEVTSIELVSDFSAKVKTELVAWRIQNFGTEENQGDAADDADPDKDSVSNIMEFYLGTDPNSFSAAFDLFDAQKEGGNWYFSAAVEGSVGEGVVSFESSEDLLNWGLADSSEVEKAGNLWVFRGALSGTLQKPSFIRWRLGEPGIQVR
ncbi:glycoside hydrolase family 9 protein [Pelagicoccus mobilis]|uniref:Glycoside hydrolase family 9 protein n=1 Tax=Pelagicoccus mobilis TaxID=415221 RepID=A0A934VQS6_9BACT|nr:glycoside hydrolase family 9 protein [Pelagicoccus mobilis]MBK1876878.1 glycoside hydrolase family 9 protein [Pelagicoccus mobilis]